MNLWHLNKIKIYLFFVVISLAGCSTNTKKTFLKSTAVQLQKQYHYQHGELIINYDLTNLNNDKCIYAKDLGCIINDITYSKAFLKRIKSCSVKEISKQSLVKILQISDLLLRLNNKYKFLTSDQLHYLKKCNNNSNPLKELMKLDKISSSIPIMLPEYKVKITSYYGMRSHPNKKRKKFHSGIDLKGHKATPIYAAADGRIITVSRKGAYGNLIEIKHSGRFITKYAHLKKISVLEGEVVIRGQIIGLQGNTGNSTGEHLHFEVLLDNRPINPWEFISHACNC